MVTPNAHFIPTSLSDQSAQTSPRKQQPPIPSVCLTCDTLAIAIVQPLYSRNASMETQQKVNIEATHYNLTGGIVYVQSLSDILKQVSLDSELVAQRSKQFLHLGKCVDIPLASLSYDSTSVGNEGLGSSTVQIDFNEISCSSNIKQFNNFFLVTSSWIKGTPLQSKSEINLKPVQMVPLNQYLTGKIKKFSCTKSSSETQSSFSLLFSNIVMSIAKGGKPSVVFNGPVDSSSWSTVYDSREEGVSHQEDTPNLMELFIANPHKNLEGKYNL